MKFFCSLFIAFLLFNACSRPVKQKAVEAKLDPKTLISCGGVGDVKLHYSYEDLENKFGKEALSEHENSRRGKYVTLWENKPEQLNLYWKEQVAPFKSIAYIEIVGEGAPYTTESGFKVGISIRELVKMNSGMAVTFNNFTSEDENGLITSFNNGGVLKDSPCVTGVLEIVGQRNIHVDEMDEFNKQEVVQSYDRLLERIDVSLASIRVYPQDQQLSSKKSD